MFFNVLAKKLCYFCGFFFFASLSLLVTQYIFLVLILKSHSFNFFFSKDDERTTVHDVWLRILGLSDYLQQGQDFLPCHLKFNKYQSDLFCFLPTILSVFREKIINKGSEVTDARFLVQIISVHYQMNQLSDISRTIAFTLVRNTVLSLTL